MSDSARADIVPTGNRWMRAAGIVIDSPAADIFDVIADPRRHVDFDGSGTVVSLVSGPSRLSLGARFGVSMRIGLPYRVENTVVEFDEGRRIAWRHFNGHRWRYELEPIDDTHTRVIETFDGSTARFPPGLLLIRAFDKNQIAVAKTLVRLKGLMESPRGSST